jgi:protein required for attachment to host cells
MPSIWIVVADNCRARIFTTESSSSPLQELEDLTHAESRLHDREITQDLPGRHTGTGGTGHPYDSATDPKKYEAVQFAHQIAGYLEDARNANRFDRLLIIAEPSMLGLLRKELPEQVKKHIAFELDKNITTLGAAEIRDHLPEYLPKLEEM